MTTIKEQQQLQKDRIQKALNPEPYNIDFLEKAKIGKQYKLVALKKLVSKEGQKPFMQTFWVSPEEAEAYKKEQQAKTAAGKEIAQTTLNQIGQKALYMIGAKNIGFSSKDGSVQFKVMKNSKGVGMIKVKYNKGLDLYDMEFYTTHGNLKHTESGLYSDMLNKMIEKNTELYTSLGTLGKPEKPLVQKPAEPVKDISAKQLEAAKELGKVAYQAGKTSAPAHDKAYLGLIEGRNVGETPEGQASTVALAEAWQKGWHEENANSTSLTKEDIVKEIKNDALSMNRWDWERKHPVFHIGDYDAVLAAIDSGTVSHAEKEFMAGSTLYSSKKLDEPEISKPSYSIDVKSVAPNIGWFTSADKDVKHGGFVIRATDSEFDDKIGAEFRVAKPYEEEYIKHESGVYQQNPAFWSLPAKRGMGDSILVYTPKDNDTEEGDWVKWEGNLDIKDFDTLNSSNFSQDKLLPVDWSMLESTKQKLNKVSVAEPDAGDGYPDSKGYYQARINGIEVNVKPKISKYGDQKPYMNMGAISSAIRQYIKKRYPNVQFKIKSDSFSMGDSVDVYLKETLSEKAFDDMRNEIVSTFQAGHFNSMDDIYEYGEGVKPQIKIGDKLHNITTKWMNVNNGSNSSSKYMWEKGDEDELLKSLEQGVELDIDELIKGGKLPIGTVKSFKDGMYQKVAENKWIPYAHKADYGAGKAGQQRAEKRVKELKEGISMWEKMAKEKKVDAGEAKTHITKLKADLKLAEKTLGLVKPKEEI